MTNKVEFTTQLQCEACGQAGVKVTITRDRGMGAELKLTCPSCGHEKFGDMNEESSLKWREMANRQAH